VVGNVQKAIRIWASAIRRGRQRLQDLERFHNQYWPALYFIDGTGTIRHHHFGEGEYDDSERIIQRLLKENGASVAAGLAEVSAQGVQAPASNMYQISPETYVGYARAEHFASPQTVARDQPARYSCRPPSAPTSGRWGVPGL